MLISLNERSLKLLDTKKSPTNPTEKDTGLIPRCIAERTDAHWGPFDTTGKGNGVFQPVVGQKISRNLIYTKDLTSSLVKTFGLIDPLTTALFCTLGLATCNGIQDTEQTYELTQTGSEVEQFCSIPIISGYSHGDIIRPDSSNNQQTVGYTFRNHDDPKGDAGGEPPYTGIPLVNAQQIYGDIKCTGLCSWGVGKLASFKDDRVDINIDCNTVFKANTTDYTHAGDPAF